MSLRPLGYVGAFFFATLAILCPVAQAADPPLFVTKWGSFGTGNGQFNSCRAVATDAAGNVFVSDYFNSRIQKFSGAGLYLTQWGSAGSGNGQFRASGVAVDADGNVFVADRMNSRIQKFTNSGVFVSTFGSQGSGDGQFNGLAGIDVAPSGEIYVADLGNQRIHRFTNNGSLLGYWGALGGGDGQFSDPYDVAVAANGDVYVADAGNDRVQWFTPDGFYLGQFGGSGVGDGQLNNPWSVAVDRPTGQVYVADTKNERIQRFSASGVFETKWGTGGSGDGEFVEPVGVAVDVFRNVYVVEALNHRVQKFVYPSPEDGPDCTSPPNTMVSWWPLDDATGATVQELAKNLVGKAVNSPVFVSGRVNGAYCFSNPQMIQIPNSKPLLQMGTDDFSLDAWVRIDESGGGSIFRRPIFCNAFQENHQGYMFYISGSDEIGLGIGDASESHDYVSTATIAIGQWEHVAVSVRRKGSNPLGTFYLNGSAVGTFSPFLGNINHPFQASAYPPMIGQAWLGLVPGGAACGAMPNFDGCVDELEIFRRALDAADVQAIASAGAFGKCEISCNVPRVLEFCPSEATKDATISICNYGSTTQNVSWSLAGLPAGGASGCTVNGPTVFAPASGSALLAPGECTSVPVTITKPATLPSYASGCYRITVQTNGNTVCESVGSVLGAPPLSYACMRRVGSDFVQANFDTVTFDVNNTATDTRVLRYRAEPRLADSAELDSSVTLNGTTPGGSVVDSLTLPPLSTQSLHIQVALGDADPFRTHDVLVLRDDGPSGPVVPVASASFRSSLPAAVLHFDCNGNGTEDAMDIANATSSDTNSNGVPDECEILTCVDVEPLGDPSPQRFLGGVPNPSSGLVQLRFALPACAGTTVGIFDVSGRSLRALALEPGASGIVWDGRDVGGRRARPGLYFVRLSSSCGSARGSILIMR